MKFRLIAIYLPQFYPIPENDEWWGKGFTDWINVTKAKPRFKEHYQPHLPSDLGFYDLRLSEIREEQAKLAKEHGIYGFCYYHYWFNGKRLLNRPLDEVVESKTPDFPFCVCWANEDWTRSWDGQSGQVLLHQEYSDNDDIQHMQFLCRNIFNDNRYIRIDNKPVFIVYRIQNFPDAKKTATLWRNVAKEEGIGEIYLCAMQSMGRKNNPKEFGFDASIEFQPDYSSLPERLKGSLWQRILNKLCIKENPFYNDKIYRYSDYVNLAKNAQLPLYKQFPGITPSWDNAARRKKEALIMHQSTPVNYGEWLKDILEKFIPYSKEENLVFINAWNEWAEGNHLEPCQRWDKAYLEKTKEIINQYRM